MNSVQVLLALTLCVALLGSTFAQTYGEHDSSYLRSYKQAPKPYYKEKRERIYIQNLNLNDLQNKQKIRQANEAANSNWNSNDVYDLINKKEKIERVVPNYNY